MTEDTLSRQIAAKKTELDRLRPPAPHGLENLNLYCAAAIRRSPGARKIGRPISAHCRTRRPGAAVRDSTGFFTSDWTQRWRNA
ncbi:MAG TPA: hypothetical protein VHT21_07735 [Stellaceae bacterium]|nr:hypothetical protein [Stellaceae bacterium]